MGKKVLQPPRSSKLLCEFTGSFFLVLAAISPIILFNDIFNSGIALAVLADAIAVGFVLFVLIEVFQPISGCYINPAVCIANMVLGVTKVRDGVLCIGVQIVGGISGMLATHLMFYHEIPKIIEISDISRTGGNYFAEFLGTFILITAILFLSRYKSKHMSLSIGMLVGGMLIATSSTMFANPQVTIARIFTYSDAGINVIDAGIFIIAEILGTIAAVLFYKLVFNYDKKRDYNIGCC